VCACVLFHRICPPDSCLCALSFAQGLLAPAGTNATAFPVSFTSSDNEHDLFLSTGKWHSAAGTFILEVATDKTQSQLNPGSVYTIGLVFDNPASPRSSSVVGMAPHASSVELYRVENSVASSDNCSSVLHIKPLTFRTTSCMSYTSPWAAGVPLSLLLLLSPAHFRLF